MSEIDFMGYKCSFHVDTDKVIHYEHNIRDSKLIKHEKHIDPTKFSEVSLDLGHLDKAYETIFGEAMKEYNEHQRKDRRIKSYLELIRKDARRGKHLNQKADGSRKPAYEAVIQIGCAENQPDPEKTFKILKLFVEKWIPEHYPNIKPILIAYHGDEFYVDKKTKQKLPSGFHCHLDYIYVAHCLTDEEYKQEMEYREKCKEIKKAELESKGIAWDEKKWKEKDWREDMVRRTGKSLTKGMSIQASMTSALLEMGFKTGNGTTAQIQFEEQVRHDLQDFAESMGLKIDRTPGEKHKHDEKSVYQEKKELKKAQQKFQKEKEDFQKEKENFRKEKEELNKARFLVNKQIKENLQITEQNKKKEDELSKQTEFIKSKQALVNSFENISDEVTKNQLSIDKIESEFWKKEKSHSLKERITSFVSDCKKVVTNLAVQLSKYKNTFERFWKWKPNQFRELADKMEKNNCENFEQYQVRKRFGILTAQKIEEPVNKKHSSFHK